MDDDRACYFDTAEYNELVQLGYFGDEVGDVHYRASEKLMDEISTYVPFQFFKSDNSAGNIVLRGPIGPEHVIGGYIFKINQLVNDSGDDLPPNTNYFALHGYNCAARCVKVVKGTSFKVGQLIMDPSRTHY